MAVGTDLLFQEFLHPFHAFFILYLRQSILHGINRVVVGKIQLRRLVGALGFVNDMLLYRGAVKDDLLFLI